MRALRERHAGRPVECAERDSDRYGHTGTVCRVDGADLKAGNRDVLNGARPWVVGRLRGYRIR